MKDKYVNLAGCDCPRCFRIHLKSDLYRMDLDRLIKHAKHPVDLDLNENLL